MMPKSQITQWGVSHPWQNENQIEQDLLLSVAMIEIANDSLLGKELVLRGGTAFHKLETSDGSHAASGYAYGDDELNRRFAYLLEYVQNAIAESTPADAA